MALIWITNRAVQVMLAMEMAYWRLGATLLSLAIEAVPGIEFERIAFCESCVVIKK